MKYLVVITVVLITTSVAAAYLTVSSAVARRLFVAGVTNPSFALVRRYGFLQAACIVLSLGRMRRNGLVRAPGKYMWLVGLPVTAALTGWFMYSYPSVFALLFSDKVIEEFDRNLGSAPTVGGGVGAAFQVLIWTLGLRRVTDGKIGRLTLRARDFAYVTRVDKTRVIAELYWLNQVLLTVVAASYYPLILLSVMASRLTTTNSRPPSEFMAIRLLDPIVLVGPAIVVGCVAWALTLRWRVETQTFRSILIYLGALRETEGRAGRRGVNAIDDVWILQRRRLRRVIVMLRRSADRIDLLSGRALRNPRSLLLRALASQIEDHLETIDSASGESSERIVNNLRLGLAVVAGTTNTDAYRLLAADLEVFNSHGVPKGERVHASRFRKLMMGTPRMVEFVAQNATGLAAAMVIALTLAALIFGNLNLREAVGVPK